MFLHTFYLTQQGCIEDLKKASFDKKKVTNRGSVPLWELQQNWMLGLLQPKGSVITRLIFCIESLTINPNENYIYL